MKHSQWWRDVAGCEPNPERSGWIDFTLSCGHIVSVLWGLSPATRVRGCLCVLCRHEAIDV